MRIPQAEFAAGLRGEGIWRQRSPTTLTARVAAARAAGLAGVILYNWWVPAAVTGIMPSTRDFFSDLEAQGQQHSALFSHLDVLSGLLIVFALLLRGAGSTSGRSAGSTSGRSADRTWLLVFGFAAIVGGLFPYTCAEGLDAACRTAEWSFRLPLRHYVHIVAGICEFAAATAAVASAWRRTSVGVDRSAIPVRALGWTMIVFYPALAIAYLSDRYGALVEPIFFTAFSAMVLIVVFEQQPAQDPTHRTQGPNG